MMMVGHVIESAVFFFILFQLCFRCESDNKRCSSEKQPRCQLFHNTMTLKCDLTNFQSIPNDHQVAFARAPPYKAEFLYVNHSCLVDIDKNILMKYTRLLTLDLSNNKIKKIEDESFANLNKLKRLHLSGNLVSSIHHGAFKGLNLLLHLYLDNNKLQQLSSKTLDSVGSLQVLKLNNNELQSIPEAALSHLSKLTFLDLSGNSLHQLPPQHFKGMGELRTLRLGGNQLSEFDKRTFLSASGIQELDLSDNNIQCLDEDTFDDQHLSKLQLSGNPLETPKPEWFLSLVEIYKSEAKLINFQFLSQNGSWICDCKANIYRKFLEELNQKPRLLAALNIRCSAPESLSGRLLNDLTWDEISKTNGCFDRDEEALCSVDRKTIKIVTMTTEVYSDTTRSIAKRHQSTATDELLLLTNKQTDIFNETQTTMLVPGGLGGGNFQWTTDHLVLLLSLFLVFLVITTFVICKRKQENKEPDENATSSQRENIVKTPVTHRLPLVTSSNNNDSRVEGVYGGASPYEGYQTIEETSQNLISLPQADCDVRTSVTNNNNPRAESLHEDASPVEEYERIEESSQNITQNVPTQQSGDAPQSERTFAVNQSTSFPHYEEPGSTIVTSHTNVSSSQHPPQNINAGMTQHFTSEPVYVIGYTSVPVAHHSFPAQFVPFRPPHNYPHLAYPSVGPPSHQNHVVFNSPPVRYPSQCLGGYMNSAQLRANCSEA